MRQIILLLTSVVLFSSCQPAAVDQYVFAVSISPETGKLEEYLRYHDNIWPEVEAGFKKAGYNEIKLFRYHHLIVMTIKVPKGANLDEMSRSAESGNPRCAEWNRLMDTYQIGVPGTSSGEKWVKMDEFYSFTLPQ